MKNYNYYKQYSVEQWLMDSDFVQWLKNPNNPDYRLFTELRNYDDDIAEKMNKAAELLSDILITEPILTKNEVSEMWENINTASRNENERSVRFPVWVRRLSVAASILLVIGISMLWVYTDNKKMSYVEFAKLVSVDTIESITLKLNNKPAITIPNRSEIIFSDSNNILVRTAKGDEISMNNVDFSNHDLGWLAVPKGKRASVVFADGSKITLRPGSKVVFPTEFSEKTRNVFVEGEAFLEVAKNKHKPFIVKTNQMEVEVLGTSFDVQAYPKNQLQSVVLVTGKVKVRTTENRATEITPNQKFSFNVKANTEAVNQVDVNEYVSWKDGVLSFESEKLSNILNEVSSYYGVNFEYDSVKLNDITLSGKLNLNDNFEDVKIVLATISGVNFETMKTKIKINVKP